MNTFLQNKTIFMALLARDIKVLKSRVHNVIIDGLILVSITVLVFGNLLPLLGMPISLIAPAFLGNSLSFFLASLGYNFALRMAYDLKYDRFISYFLTLPLPKCWLFSYYVISFMIESLIVSLPLVTLGIVALGKNFGPINGNIFVFFVVYLCSLLFWALFFLGSSFIYNFQWFKSHLWARRIMPLFIFSPAYFTFKTIQQILPLFHKFYFLNPLTYIIEGLRVSLLGNNDYLSLPICLMGILASLIFMLIRLRRGIYKQLDPV